MWCIFYFLTFSNFLSILIRRCYIQCYVRSTYAMCCARHPIQCECVCAWWKFSFGTMTPNIQYIYHEHVPCATGIGSTKTSASPLFGVAWQCVEAMHALYSRGVYTHKHTDTQRQRCCMLDLWVCVKEQFAAWYERARVPAVHRRCELCVTVPGNRMYCSIYTRYRMTMNNENLLESNFINMHK